jgi:hypothetical protein
MDIIEDIKGLKNLLDKGAITEEEFNSLKKKILSKDTGRNELNTSSSESSLKETRITQQKPDGESAKVESTAAESETTEFEAGNGTTIKIFKWGLGLCLLLGGVFWVRYDSIFAMLVSTVISVATVLFVSRKISRVRTRNITLGLISLAVILLMVIPVSGKNSSDNSGSVNAISTEQTGDEGKQTREFLVDNTFANYGSGPAAYLRFTSSNGGWYGAMTMSMGSCDFVYSYNLEDKTIELSYTGSNCDAAFTGSSMKMYVNDDNSISVYIQGQEMKFSAI